MLETTFDERMRKGFTSHINKPSTFEATRHEHADHTAYCTLPPPVKTPPSTRGILELLTKNIVPPYYYYYYYYSNVKPPRISSRPQDLCWAVGSHHEARQGPNVRLTAQQRPLDDLNRVVPTGRTWNQAAPDRGARTWRNQMVCPNPFFWWVPEFVQ